MTFGKKYSNDSRIDFARFSFRVSLLFINFSFRLSNWTPKIAQMLTLYQANVPITSKIDLYNFKLYRFKVGAFFETQCSSTQVFSRDESSA